MNEYAPITSESIELEIQRNTTKAVYRLPWQSAAHNNAKPKVVRVRQVKSMPVMTGML